MRDTPGHANFLESIVAATRRCVEERERTVPIAALEARPFPETRSFLRAVTVGKAPRVIAECKRRSPSRGLLCPDYDPAAIAAAYARAGAAAISVLTEPEAFDGKLEHLSSVRAAVDVPVLRKDFIVTEYQLFEARAVGADAVLLIVAAFAAAANGLRALIDRARALDLDVVVEVHDEAELARALDAGAAIVGVNGRNLRTLDVSLDAARALAPRIPQGIARIAESGITTPRDLRALAASGYDAFLVGERLMTAADPGAALLELRQC